MAAARRASLGARPFPPRLAIGAASAAPSHESDRRSLLRRGPQHERRGSTPWLLASNSRKPTSSCASATVCIHAAIGGSSSMSETNDFDDEARRLTKELRASAERVPLRGSRPDSGPAPAEHRGRRTAVELLSAGVLAVAVVALILALPSRANPTSKTSGPTQPVVVPPPTPPVVVSLPTPSPPSAGKFIVDLTWVSDQTGWALSAVECASGLCPELASTIDGGKTWRQLPSPPALIQSGTVDCSKTDCISHVRFASTMFGYLYGPALLVTSDGGH